jgi:signal transduction histidine kinase
MRARRLVAAGEIALRFQHSVNNPLAGILAEAQLMQLDPVTAEQNEALERIVMLCRRIIELGRTLDGMGERSR